MNIAKTILVGTVLGLCLSACTSEDFSVTDVRQGSMSLNVDKLTPGTTRAGEEINPSNFPVSIYTLTDNKLFASYDKASQVPNKIQMPVGDYYAEAHTPVELTKIMDKPYYAGRDKFEIVKNINTESTVICRMANGQFTISFEEDFANVFSKWTISIDDGTETAIIFTEEDGLNPAPMYLTFEENVKSLNVNFVGTAASGKITANNTLTKKSANQQYDSDKEYFSGGDCIEIKFAPVESTEGTITGITLKAEIKFEESEETFEMEVEDNITDNGGEEEGGETPGGDNSGEGDDSAITLELPKNMTVTGDTDPSLGDTKITAENGIQSIIVRVTSTSEDMTGALAELGGTYEGIDFENGTEVVSNEGLVSMFSDLNSPLNVPAAGEKEYVFPIGKFFSFLLLLPGDHTFILAVTDMNGNTKDGQLTLTIE